MCVSGVGRCVSDIGRYVCKRYMEIYVKVIEGDMCASGVGR